MAAAGQLIKQFSYPIDTIQAFVPVTPQGKAQVPFPKTTVKQHNSSYLISAKAFFLSQNTHTRALIFCLVSNFIDLRAKVMFPL